MAQAPAKPECWWKKLGWMLLIWALSVGALGIVAYLLHGFMRLAGLA